MKREDNFFSFTSHTSPFLYFSLKIKNLDNKNIFVSMYYSIFLKIYTNKLSPYLRAKITFFQIFF